MFFLKLQWHRLWWLTSLTMPKFPLLLLMVFQRLEKSATLDSVWTFKSLLKPERCAQILHGTRANGLFLNLLRHHNKQYTTNPTDFGVFWVRFFLSFFKGAFILSINKIPLITVSAIIQVIPWTISRQQNATIILEKYVFCRYNFFKIHGCQTIAKIFCTKLVSRTSLLI